MENRYLPKVDQSHEAWLSGIIKRTRQKAGKSIQRELPKGFLTYIRTTALAPSIPHNVPAKNDLKSFLNKPVFLQDI